MSQGELSIVAAFDELCRYGTVLTEGCETEFLKFVLNQDECRKKWLLAEQECQRLQGAVTKAQGEINALETKMKHVRHLLELEMKARKKAEQEREALERQVALIRELLITDQPGLNNETREKLAFLNSWCGQRRNPNDSFTGGRLNTITEHDSTGSMLSGSDLSYDKSEDDVDVSVLRSGKTWKVLGTERKRPSAPPAELNTSKRRRSGKRSDRVEAVEVTSHDQVVATTTVTVPADGPIHASSVIEANPAGIKIRSGEGYMKSIPPRNLQQGAPLKQDHGEPGDSFWACNTPVAVRNKECPGQRPLCQYTPTVTRSLSSSNKITNRNHAFCTKTVIKPENCLPCGKRIKFGKLALKCKDCRATCHPDCKDQVPLPCVPTTNTPTGKGIVHTIADYTPLIPPMVPALIVHCLNEIETRGLSEVGLYRIPGSEREVKDLKEKFLRGKGAPNLSKIDIHVICGTVKDFLRSLKEPVISHTLWRDFVQAAECPDPHDAQSTLYQAISELPQPNRDTLAYMILHLQRVAECHECKMPASNLAKVFGPTLVGYSSSDPEPAVMLQETKKQQMVMEKLMSISSDYWSNFVNVEAETAVTLKTPEPYPTPISVLGNPAKHDTPLGFSSGRRQNKHLASEMPNQSRFYSFGQRKTVKRQQYFASPMF